MIKLQVVMDGCGLGLVPEMILSETLVPSPRALELSSVQLERSTATLTVFHKKCLFWSVTR